MIRGRGQADSLTCRITSASAALMMVGSWCGGCFQGRGGRGWRGTSLVSQVRSFKPAGDLVIASISVTFFR